MQMPDLDRRRLVELEDDEQVEQRESDSMTIGVTRRKNRKVT